MADFDYDTAGQFVAALIDLITLPVPQDMSQEVATAIFSVSPRGTVSLERLAAQAAAEDLDAVHLEFDPGREAAGPSNIIMCEYRDDRWHVWPRCQVWQSDDGVPLLTPLGADFGLAFNGAGLIHVTDLPSARRPGARRARARLLSLRREGARRLREQRTLH